MEGTGAGRRGQPGRLITGCRIQETGFWVQGTSGNGPVIYWRADKGKWKQLSMWTWESGDWDRWKSLDG